MKKYILIFILFTISTASFAQSWQQSGKLWGSFESNSMYYVNDSKLNPIWVEDGDRFATNNYLKLDYNLGNFSAGIQLESYLPALQGFDFGMDYKKFFLGSKYIQWQDNRFFVRAGNIYDQFGSGIIFRSYEDRSLGFNNSIEGVQGMFNYNNIVRINALAGRPRLNTDYQDTWVRGADLIFSVSDALKLEKLMFAVEGSYVHRYGKLEDASSFVSFPDDYGINSRHLNMYSGRINLGFGPVVLKGEYVKKQNKDYNSAVIDKETAVKGDAIFGELGVNLDNFGMLATFRRLKGMETLISFFSQSLYNSINYIPALTRQYTYSLANLNPYITSPNGEIGGQVDLYYSIRNAKSKFWNLHANFSNFYTLKDKATENKSVFLWRDINFDVERQWNRNFKTSFLYSRQQYNPDKGHAAVERERISNIFVLDITNKFSKKLSLRSELQYLYTEKNYNEEKDWVAALFELSIAPKWSIFISDMFNIEKNLHYYNGGFSFSHKSSRVQLSYGRNRDGMVCSGGVCRYTPAYTGVNMILTTSF